MKIRVRIEDRTYEVEVGDLATRPVVAVVDGERFEVWPEAEERAADRSAAGAAPLARSAGVFPVSKQQRETHNRNIVLAPIPGVIVSVSVRPGATVTPGQELCVLEAMKMKNVIRATAAGIVVSVRVAPGQHVAHREVLMEMRDGHHAADQ